ncbi:MAG: hypothetical protein ACLQDL_13160 [Spirochaetia bacterium]
MKQPVLGIVSTVLVIVVSLGFIAIFTLAEFTTWVAYALICCIPMVIVIDVTWGAKRPDFAARHSQPARGLLLVLPVLAAGALVGLAHFVAVGGRVSPPAPMLSMCIITTVVIAFWLAIMWGGWPFVALAKKPVVAGLSMLAACYVVNYLLFRLFFNYGFMRDSSASLQALDPHGLFNAWYALVAYVTTTAVMFLTMCFELWPLSKRPALMRQPLRGAIWTAAVLAIGAIALFIGEGLLRMDAPVFMVRVPIPFIFGTIIVLNMMEDSVFARFSQPLKGALNACAAAMIGVVLSRTFVALEPAISGRAQSGSPGYVFEIWLASALLAVTFPFLIIHADLFQFWPLRRKDPEKTIRPGRA